MNTKPQVLVLIPMQQAFLDAMQTRYDLHYAPSGPHPDVLARCMSLQVRAIVTNGSIGLSRDQMAQLPYLELICCYGAGHENVDIAAANERCVSVSHAPGVNNRTVADHAMALLMASARGLTALDQAVRAGNWSGSRAPRPSISGKRLGILGLGNIGEQIARRAEGFEMAIGYHTRQVRPESRYRYYVSVIELAANSDFLVLACPGGAATRHLVNREVLQALGCNGFLINIARGSVVDTAALIEALNEGIIAGAALDVVEGEPSVPDALLRCPNLILTPHVSGRSPESQLAQHNALMVRLGTHFENA